MRQELDEKLVAEFPKIFKNRFGDLRETAMCWGFSCADGWYWLIHNLCASLQWDIDHNKQPQIVATQVKEKFGGLRFYTETETERQGAMISLASSMSEEICEICGSTKSVEQTKGGWVKTLCPKCMKAEAEKWENTESKN